MGRYSRSRSRSHSRSRSPEAGYRVHVADLGMDAGKRDVEKAIEKYGPVMEVWMARGPPCFAFAVFKYKEDAEDCVREMNGKVVAGNRVRVTHALPRTRGRGRRRFDPNMRCYQCGERGHFSRDCDDVWQGRRRGGGGGGGGGRDDRSRDRYQQSRRSRSRSGSRDRYRRRRSPSRSKSRSPVSRRRSKSPVARVSRSRSRSVN